METESNEPSGEPIHTVNVEWKILNWKFHRQTTTSSPFYCNSLSNVGLIVHLSTIKNAILTNDGYDGVVFLVKALQTIWKIRNATFRHELRLDNGVIHSGKGNIERHRVNHCDCGSIFSVSYCKEALGSTNHLIFSTKLEFTVEPKQGIAINNTLSNFYQTNEGDYSYLLEDNNSGQFSDCTIETEDTSIQVHKLILCKQSDVFRAILMNDSKEKAAGIVRISNFSTDSVRTFLNYLYGGKIDIETIRQQAVELAQLSHMYQVNDLFDITTKVLTKEVNSHNVVEYSKIAWLYNICNLKSVCITILKCHHAQVLTSEEWLDYVKGSPKVTQDIVQQLMS